LDNEQIWPVRWSQKRRLEFIEFRLLWEGRINRSDLMDFFGISMPQASLDFAKYRELAPENAVYDSAEKTYTTGNTFKPVLVSTSPDGYLNRLLAVESGYLPQASTFLGWLPPTGIVHGPGRSVDTLALRVMLQAIRERRTVEITYQSMNTADPEARKVSPHALGFDGLRWHARAFCHRRQTYRDFVLARVFAITIESIFETDPQADMEWHNTIEAIIVPAPLLSDSQRRAIELDYGMVDGRLVLNVREALLFYYLRHLGLLEESGKESATTEQIALANRAELEPFFKKHANEPR
jgi:WYL domain